MKITWIRHGMTDENEKETYYGDLEATLNATGKKQIEILKSSIPKATTIYASPKKRCMETAALLGYEENILVDRRLEERHMGVWEGMTYEAIKNRDAINCAKWDKDWIHYVVEGGESAIMQYTRIKSFVKSLEEKQEDAVIVAHSGSIRMALAYMLGEQIDFFFKFKIDPATKVETYYEDGYWYIGEIASSKVSAKNSTGEVILVTGGSRSGKSYFAEQLLKDQEDVLYIATALITDEEMKERVHKHQLRRNKNWETYEGYRGLGEVIKQSTKEAILLDCVTIFISNFMFEEEAFESLSEAARTRKWQEMKMEMGLLIEAAKESKKELVLVTNELGNGVVPAYALGRVYRDLVGSMNQYIATLATRVYEVKCGIPMVLK